MRVDYPGAQNQDFRYLHRRLRRTAWPRALDAGCGRGLYLRELGRAGGFVTGVDRSFEDLCAIVPADARAAVVNGHVEQLPYGSDVFDLVLCAEVLTLIPQERQAAAVQELFRVLRPGGVLVISVHNAVRHRVHRIKRSLGPVRPRAAGAATYPLSVARLRRMLTTAGFQICSRVRHVNFFNRFGFNLARRRPALTAALAWCEDVMTVIPVVRRLSITRLIEDVKPAETGRTAHGDDRRFP